MPSLKFVLGELVDLVGIEPTTSSMPWKRAPSCATGPREENFLYDSRPPPTLSQTNPVRVRFEENKQNEYSESSKHGIPACSPTERRRATNDQQASNCSLSLRDCLGRPEPGPGDCRGASGVVSLHYRTQPAGCDSPADLAERAIGLGAFASREVEGRLGHQTAD